MRAAVSRAPGEITIEEVGEPSAGFGEVKVRMVASGICHTDVSVLQGHLPSPRPIVLGHEGAGVIEALGDGVTGLAVGDHVICSIISSCGECFQCVRGERALCERSIGFGGTMLDHTTRMSLDGDDLHVLFCQGSFAEKAVVPASAVVRVPEAAPLDRLAGLGCALSTGLGAALVRADIRPGSSVVVIGAGGVGLAVMMGAQTVGASTVIAVDRAPKKLERAASLGLATHTITTDTDVPAAVAELTGGRGADYSFDAVGAMGTLEMALGSIRPGGLTVAIGVMDATVTANFDLFGFLMHKRLTGTYAGSIVPQRDIPTFVEMYLQGRLPIDSLIDATYSLDEVPKALQQLEANEITKGVVVF